MWDDEKPTGAPYKIIFKIPESKAGSKKWDRPLQEMPRKDR